MPLQNMRPDGTMRTRYKAVVAIGDKDGWFGMGQKTKKTKELAISGATTAAFVKKFRVVRGSWVYGNLRTVPFRVTAKCGHVKVIINPAPEGVGMEGHPIAKNLLRLAGIEDCVLSTKGDCDRYHLNLACAICYVLQKLDAVHFTD